MIEIIQELVRITQAVSLVSTPKEQVDVMVNEISRYLNVAVCSIYRRESSGDLVLLATHGLSATRPVRIPAGKGLVGLVASGRHTVNLANGLQHPAYFHVPDIKEERFTSFCGAPLVSAGEVIGVLVVQGRQASVFSKKQEAFITTLASHIALIIQQLPNELSLLNVVQVSKGLVASEGLAIGNPVFCTLPELKTVGSVKCQSIATEIDTWYDLKQTVLSDLETEKLALGLTLPGEVTNMFEAYKLLLTDSTLNEKVVEGIRTELALPSALKQAVVHFSDLFQQMEDPYLKARSEDVWHVGNKLYQAYSSNSAEPQSIMSADSQLILIGDNISVSDIAKVPVSQLKAIVSGTGSRLSHTAIVANALGIPALMNVSELSRFSQAKLAIVDGVEGKVLFDPDASLLSVYQDLLKKRLASEQQLQRFRDVPALSKDGDHVFMFVNSGLLSDITPGLKFGAEGIGLFRTEIPFIVSDTFPTEQEQTDLYRSVFKHYAGKPVYMRTLDIGADKQLPYFPILGEENPAMGWRGIRFTLDNVQLLMTQLRAMLTAAGETGDLRVIIPMVSNIGELKRFHEVLNDACQQLREEGVACKRPPVGVMVEVPAAISQLKFWAPYVDFVSIGSNDLSQYLLAIDRNNPKLTQQFDHVHPAVVAEIARVVATCKELDLPVCVCGEMASEPIAVILLFALGVRRLSVSSSKIPRLKSLIAQLDRECSAEFLAFALAAESTELIRAEGLRLLNKIGYSGS